MDPSHLKFVSEKFVTGEEEKGWETSHLSCLENNYKKLERFLFFLMENKKI